MQRPARGPHEAPGAQVEERTRKLSEAAARVQQLGDLLPICAWCKKIRDDQDYWLSVDDYVSAHTETRVTHGVCPECLSQLAEEAQSGTG